ncbi:hypothetical protein ABQ381_20600 [Serratia fonticola]|uniref:hypothetical protein n=1 Tax=Serratia fonticola TaxID=47917 RepID=UPI0027F9BFCD|nr:hypothetical protein [Serratia fonticola]MDQ7207700.1 hypothetical protein [Serratia fonticola]HBE9150663.1 hypothetical protein [Serratia fonticola]
MADKNVDLMLYPVDAAYQVVLELAKAGAFNTNSDKGTAIINCFDKLQKKFEAVQSGKVS